MANDLRRTVWRTRPLRNQGGGRKDRAQSHKPSSASSSRMVNDGNGWLGCPAGVGGAAARDAAASTRKLLKSPSGLCRWAFLLLSGGLFNVQCGMRHVMKEARHLNGFSLAFPFHITHFTLHRTVGYREYDG